MTAIQVLDLQTREKLVEVIDAQRTHIQGGGGGGPLTFSYYLNGYRTGFYDLALQDNGSGVNIVFSSRQSRIGDKKAFDLTGNAVGSES